MLINELPVWIKVWPTPNRFGYYQLGYWYIYDIKKLPQILKENAEDPNKRFVGYISSENKVDQFQDAIWNDRRNLLNPHLVTDGKTITSAEEPSREEKEEAKQESESQPIEDDDEEEDTTK